jgi:glyoxylase-like metal-dependent hydrolase (beta-lactamase superfamily II)
VSFSARGDTAEELPPPKPLVPGVASALSPLVRRILAPNPGMMTGPGTNCYLVGIDEIAVIDPGPDDESHLDAIVGCGGDRIRWILATHTHIDHWPATTALAERTGAEVLGFGEKDGFRPDRTLADGDTVEATEFRLQAVHTPGHASNHLCYLLEEERLLFSGDHVMQGSTVVINPPDGDMAAYLASLDRLREWRPRLRSIAPGHGHLIDDPKAVLDEYVSHRLDRERQVADALAAAGTATTEQLVEAIYTDVDPVLHPVARRSVWAHLRKLGDEGRATSADPDDPDAAWSAA